MSNFRYPGTQPFLSTQKKQFFGRDQDIQGILTFIENEKLSVLFGKSGMGKSSLIQAGLMPILEQEGVWDVHTIRLGNYDGNERLSPLEKFIDQLPTQASENLYWNHEIWEPGEILWLQINSLRKKLQPDDFLLIILDQFEELFTYPTKAELFAESLFAILSDRVPKGIKRKQALIEKEFPNFDAEHLLYEEEELADVKVLISIRSDKLGLLNRFANDMPDILRNCYELFPLNTQNAREAIIKPALLSGAFSSPVFEYKDAAIDNILEYLMSSQSKFIESFQLQIICSHIERNIIIKEKKSIIEPSDTEDLGLIIKNYYYNQLAQFGDAAQQYPIRLLLEEGLILEAEERRISLYQGKIQQEYGIGTDLLRRLVNTHLIRPEPQKGGGYNYELSHDTLILPILEAKRGRIAAEEETREKQRLEQAWQKKKLAMRENFRKQAWKSIRLVLIGLIVLGIGFTSILYMENVAVDKFNRDIVKVNEILYNAYNGLSNSVKIETDEKGDTLSLVSHVNRAKKMIEQHNAKLQIFNEMTRNVETKVREEDLSIREMQKLLNTYKDSMSVLLDSVQLQKALNL